MSDILESLLHADVKPLREVPREEWIPPRCRVIELKRSQGGPDVATDGHGFVS